MKNAVRVAVVGIALACGWGSAPASLITYEFRGEVDYVSPGLSRTFSVGDRMVGSYEFETEAHGTNNGFWNVYDNSFTDATVRIDSSQWELDSTASGYQSAISIRNARNDDVYSAWFEKPDGPTIRGHAPEKFVVWAADNTGSMLTSSSLTSQPPDISHLSSDAKGMQFWFDDRAEWVTASLDTLRFVKPAPPPPPPLPKPPSDIELAMLSQAAYSGVIGVGGYMQIGISPGGCNERGFCARAFLNDQSGENLVLAIAGTDDIDDWTRANPTFISPTGKPTDVFREEYVDVAAKMLLDLSRDNPNARITLTGHSLGGAIAELLADASGLDAAIFNAPGGGTTRSHMTGELGPLSTISDHGGTGNIDHYRVYGDLVSGFGEHIVDPVTYEPPIPRWQVDTVPFGTAKAMHEIGTVIERLVNDAQVTDDFGPTLVGIAGSSVVTSWAISSSGVSLGLYGLILPITNVVVAAGDALFIDPQDLDLYHFVADPGSPYFRTVTFPLLLSVDALFDLETFVDDNWTTLGLFEELETYDFGVGGLDQFRFFVLDASTGLPPDSIEPFAFGVTFASDGIFNGTVTATSTSANHSVPEPETLLLFLIGIPAIRYQCNKNLAARNSQ